MIRKPRIHSGSEEYFKRRPMQESRIISKREHRFPLERKSGGFYFFWILGGLAAIAVIYFLGNFIKTQGLRANLVFYEGEVFVKQGGDGNDWKKVEKEVKLKKMDEVKTMENSRAIVNFEDGSVLRLDEFSRVILSEESGNILVIQTDGGSYHRVSKNDDKKYFVEFTGIDGVPKTKIEALGTAFWVKKTGTEISVGVLGGKVKYTKEEKNTSFELEEGQEVLSGTDKEDKREVSIEDLTAEFISWNIDQDQKKNLALGAFVGLKLAQKETQEKSQEESRPQASEENKPEEEKKDDPATTENGTQTGIILTGTAGDNGVTLNWELKDTEAKDGLKIVKGLEANPEYPGSYYRSVRSESSKSYLWDVTDGKTHHFRICAYDGTSGCKAYSNDFMIEAKKVASEKDAESCKDSGGTWSETDKKCTCPSDQELNLGRCQKKEASSEALKEQEKSCTDSGGTWDKDNEECDCAETETLKEDRCVKKEYADSVSLSGDSTKKGEAKLSWTISGGNAPDGYKIVRSKGKDPIYPGDKGVSISKEDTKSYAWKDLPEGETYYFRVCVFDGSKCLDYSSNQKIKIKN
jgi:hypothetical protein